MARASAAAQACSCKAEAGLTPTTGSLLPPHIPGPRKRDGARRRVKELQALLPGSNQAALTSRPVPAIPAALREPTAAWPVGLPATRAEAEPTAIRKPPVPGVTIRTPAAVAAVTAGRAALAATRGAQT